MASCAACMPARHPAFFMKGMHMKTLGYYNGKYDELEKMSVPMLDRACYFGDGVYAVSYTHLSEILPYALGDLLK